MELDRYVTPDKVFKRRKHYDANAKTTSADYPVSQFGALLAASLIRLPEDTEYRVIEEYPPISLYRLNVVSPNWKRPPSCST